MGVGILEKPRRRILGEIATEVGLENFSKACFLSVQMFLLPRDPPVQGDLFRAASKKYAYARGFITYLKSISYELPLSEEKKRSLHHTVSIFGLNTAKDSASLLKLIGRLYPPDRKGNINQEGRMIAHLFNEIMESGSREYGELTGAKRK
jgi:hypothetical protein